MIPDKKYHLSIPIKATKFSMDHQLTWAKKLYSLTYNIYDLACTY